MQQCYFRLGHMLCRFPISACGSGVACFCPWWVELDGQGHQKHLLELGVGVVEVVLLALWTTSLLWVQLALALPLVSFLLWRFCLLLCWDWADAPALTLSLCPLTQLTSDINSPWGSFLTPAPYTGPLGLHGSRMWDLGLYRRWSPAPPLPFSHWMCLWGLGPPPHGDAISWWPQSCSLQ